MAAKTETRGEKSGSEVAKIFHQIDADGSGELDMEEVGQLLARMGQKVDAQGLTAIMNDIDDDHTGEVSLAEFEAWLLRGGFKGAGELQWCLTTKLYNHAIRIFDTNDF